MDFLPLFVDLKGRPCLVVGAGNVAARKVDLLLKAGAQVQVIAPDVCPHIDAIAQDGRIELLRRPFNDDDIRRQILVIGATASHDVNRAVYQRCLEENIQVNVVDQPDLCTVIFPGIIDRSPVIAAVSTGGRSPTLARIVRGWLEARLPASLGRLAEFAAEHRSRVKAEIPDATARRMFWETLLTGPLAERVLAGQKVSDSEIDTVQTSDRPRFPVVLIGAGPGDPDLLTLSAHRHLQAADVVLYDNLVSPDVLDMARRDADRIYVGKRRRFKSIRQTAIHELMIEHASSGKKVVRLKGGDPFIFGRGGEEIASLNQHGLGSIVVPGITAALGGASYAGVPLTYRNVSQSVRFVTGHLARDEVNIDWPELAKPGQTLVIYMGLLGLEDICERLVTHGMDPSTPAMVIENATRPEQVEVVGTISSLASDVHAKGIKGPSLTIVGRVIDYRV
jgi:uroporphyrin-III C-methyltransferase/precorrin-2 dehydrogenase/sirohydrochlorin ferrochelatase